MSKAARIRELYAHGLSTREIAERVGCRTEYVRTAARQRANGPSIHDRAWWSSEASKQSKRDYCRERRRSDPQYVEARRESNRRWRERKRLEASS